MTPAEKRREFLKAQNKAYRELQLFQSSTLFDVYKLLKAVKKTIKQQLLLAPSGSWDAYQLPKLQQFITQIMTELGQKLGLVGASAVAKVWTLGANLLLAPLAAVKIQSLPVLSTTPILNLKAFLLERLTDIPRAIVGKINAQLGLLSIGALDRTTAIKNIDGMLDKGGTVRAKRILTTELSRISEMAHNEARLQAAEKVPNLKKQWKHGRPKNSRHSHVAADGQIRAVKEFFDVGSVKMLHPHDPRAPAAHVINCTCQARDYLDF